MEDETPILLKALRLKWQGPAWLAPLSNGRVTSEQGKALENGTPIEGNTIVLWVDNLGVKGVM